MAQLLFEHEWAWIYMMEVTSVLRNCASARCFAKRVIREIKFLLEIPLIWAYYQNKICSQPPVLNFTSCSSHLCLCGLYCLHISNAKAWSNPYFNLNMNVFAACPGEFKCTWHTVLYLCQHITARHIGTRLTAKSQLKKLMSFILKCSKHILVSKNYCLIMNSKSFISDIKFI